MIAYIIKVSLCWILFYALYQVLYKKITFFSANRAYLIITLVLGAIIPLLQYIPIAGPQYEAVSYVAPILLEVDQLQMMVSEEQSFDYSALLFGLYILGLLVVASKFFLGVYRIFQLYVQGEKERKNNYTLVKTDKLHLPFSFYNCVFISNKLPLKEKIKTILEHELCHINERHTLDVLLVELIKIAFWCSPPVYLYKKELKQVHEYIADNVTLAHENKEEYGQLLLGQSSSGIELSLTHQFFNSHLKKRIHMMNQKKSSKKALVSYLALIPLLLFMGLSFSSYINKAESHEQQVTFEQMGDADFYRAIDLQTGETLGMFSEKTVKYFHETDQDKAPIISVFGEEIDLPLSKHYPWGEKLCMSYTPPKTTMELYGKRGKNGMITLTYNNAIRDGDPKKEIDAKFAQLIQKNESQIELERDELYYSLMNSYPEHQKYVQEKFKDHFGFVIDKVTVVNPDTKQEELRFVKTEKQASSSNAPSKLISIDTIITFDFDTQEEEIKIVRTFEKKETNAQGANDKILTVNAKEKDGKERLLTEKILGTENPRSYEIVKPTTDPEVFSVVEQMPRFPGCEDMIGTHKEKEECAKEKMLHFIYKNVKYPEDAKERGIEGITVVQFTVLKDGSLDDVKLLREIGGGCGDEAVKLIDKMSQLEEKWTPGKQQGKAVNVAYTLPIRFKLSDDTAEETSSNQEETSTVEETQESERFSPLVLLDGEEADISTINPNDIESIYVVKGAKAIAKYGSKGKDGVLEIISKKNAKSKTKKNSETKTEEAMLDWIDIAVNRMQFETFKVFPNPVGNMLNLSFISKEEGPTEIHLFDEMGKQLMTKNLDGKTCNEIFDLSGIETTQVLFLTISQNDKVHTQKVLRTK